MVLPPYSFVHSFVSFVHSFVSDYVDYDTIRGTYVGSFYAVFVISTPRWCMANGPLVQQLAPETVTEFSDVSETSHRSAR